MRKTQLLFLLPLLLGLSCGTEPGPSTATPTSQASPPNILFILIDDIGIISTPPYSSTNDSGSVWSLTPDSVPDLSSVEPYGTPQISNFVAHAKQLNYMYATPSCAPSRAQLLTGQYPYSTGITFPGWQGDSAASPQYPGTGYLANSVGTYANQLQKLGYHTGFGGKYNQRYGITDETAQSYGIDSFNTMVHNQMVHLNRHGFDETFGPSHIDTIINNDTIYRGGTALIGNTVDYHPKWADDQLFPTMLKDWGVHFINTQEESGTPYYLHYCLGLIHDSDPEAFPNMTDAEEWAMKLQLADSIIGELLAQIDDDSNTVVIIAGDNGTETYTSNFGPGYATSYYSDTIPGGKLTYQSRGSRVPFMIRWPGVIDSTPYTELVDFTDVFGTIYEIAGGTQADTLPNLDGQSFLYQITDSTVGDSTNVPRTMVYSQMQNSGFVANKRYLYVVEDVYSDTSGSWFDISSSPQVDVPIATSTVPQSTQDSLVGYFQSLGTIGLAKK